MISSSVLCPPAEGEHKGNSVNFITGHIKYFPGRAGTLAETGFVLLQRCCPVSCWPGNYEGSRGEAEERGWGTEEGGDAALQISLQPNEFRHSAESNGEEWRHKSIPATCHFILHTEIHFDFQWFLSSCTMDNRLWMELNQNQTEPSRYTWYLHLKDFNGQRPTNIAWNYVSFS